MDRQGQRVDRGARSIAASPEHVYAAFVDRRALAQWLPPDGARAQIDQFEPRPEGVFRMTLTFDAAAGKSTKNTDVVNARFIDVIPQQRISWSIKFDSPDASFNGTMKMIWTLLPERSGTRVSVAAHDVPPGIAQQDHEKAIESSLEHLAAFVERRAER